MRGVDSRFTHCHPVTSQRRNRRTYPVTLPARSLRVSGVLDGPTALKKRMQGIDIAKKMQTKYILKF